MMDLQAAIGIHQLARVEKNWQTREKIWNAYLGAFKDLPIALPTPIASGDRHAYHLFTIHVEEKTAGISRDDFLDEMNRRGVGIGVHYLSVAEHQFYRERFGWAPEQWPNAARIGRATVSLPLSPKLTDEDVQYVIASVREVVGR